MALDGEEYGLELAKHDLKQKLEELSEVIATSKEPLDKDGQIVVNSFADLINACQSQLSIISDNIDIDDVLAFGNYLVDDLGKSENISELTKKIVVIYEDPPSWLTLQLTPEPETSPKGEHSALSSKKGLQLKKRLTNLTKVAATVGALSSLTGDKLQLEPGPEVFAQAPEQATLVLNEAELVTTQVFSTIDDNRFTTHEPPKLIIPSLPDTLPRIETPSRIQLLTEPVITHNPVINAQQPSIAQRVSFISQDADRNALLNDLAALPNLNHRTVLICLLESDLDPNALSGAGAMGICQDMGQLRGAFGNPDVISALALTPELLPQIEHAEYNQILQQIRDPEIRVIRGTLLEFLKTERQADTDFWKAFVAAQTQLLTTPQTSAQISDVYLNILQTKAADLSDTELDSPQALNFGVMAYNTGFKNLERLRRAMQIGQEPRFDTDPALLFFNRDDAFELLDKALQEEPSYAALPDAERMQKLRQVYAKLREGQEYLARFLILQTLVIPNNTTT